ncbi:unnamed protein product [Lota lota]
MPLIRAVGFALNKLSPSDKRPGPEPLHLDVGRPPHQNTPSPQIRGANDGLALRPRNPGTLGSDQVFSVRLAPNSAALIAFGEETVPDKVRQGWFLQSVGRALMLRVFIEVSHITQWKQNRVNLQGSGPGRRTRDQVTSTAAIGPGPARRSVYRELHDPPWPPLITRRMVNPPSFLLMFHSALTPPLCCNASRDAPRTSANGGHR